MRQPKFKVGEEVILQSRSYPELNGETVILSVHGAKCGMNRDGVIVVEGGFSYLLTIESPIECKRWHELAVKKKHKPSEFDFQSLITNLNTKIQEKV